MEKTKGRVLIVDDEEAIRAMLAELCRQLGYESVAVGAGEPAVKRFCSERFHLVVLDKNLPDISGIEVLKRIRGRSPYVEVMIITGYASLESTIELANLRIGAFLQKPFEDIMDVRAKIRIAVERSKFLVEMENAFHDELNGGGGSSGSRPLPSS